MKFMFKNYLFMFLILFQFSCKGQEKLLRIEIRKCIKQTTNTDFFKIKSSEDFNFYKMISSVEDLLIKKNILLNKNKKSYIDFIFKSFKEKNVLKIEIKDSIKLLFYKHNYNRAYPLRSIMQGCPRYVYNKSLDSTLTFYKQMSVLDKLYALGLYNQEYLKGLVNIISDKDFDKIEYRAPIILLFLSFNNI